MLPKALLAAALASSSATAFMVPPPTGFQPAKSAEGDNDNEKGAADFSAASGASFKPNVFEAAVVTVDCPGCGLTVYNSPDHKKDDSTTVLTDVPNFLNLFLRVERNEAGDHVLINDLEVFPDVDIHHSALHAHQIPVPPRGSPLGGSKHHEDEEDEEKHEIHEHEEFDEEHDLKKHDLKKHDLKKHQPKEKRPGQPGASPEHDLRNRIIHTPVPLGYSLQMHTVGKDASNDMDVLAMTLQIIEVNDVFVQGIPAVSIHLIRKPDGTLLIGRVDVEGDVDSRSVHPLPMDGPHGPPPHGFPPHGPESEPPHGPPKGLPHPGHHGANMEELEKKLSECTNFICRWKVIFASHVAPHRCSGMGKGKGKGEGKMEGGQHNESHHNSNNHHNHHHHHHEEGHEEGQGHDEEHMPVHSMHHHHSWARLLRKFVSHVLMPVLIGVAAGVASSVVGMLVGSLIVRLYRMFVRRSRQENQSSYSGSSSSSKAAVREIGAADEKAGLMATAETEDDLPAYKDKQEDEVQKQDA